LLNQNEELDVLESTQFSNSERGDYNTQSTLDPRVTIGSIRSVKFIGVSDPFNIRVLLDVV